MGNGRQLLPLDLLGRCHAIYTGDPILPLNLKNKAGTQPEACGISPSTRQGGPQAFSFVTSVTCRDTLIPA